MCKRNDINLINTNILLTNTMTEDNLIEGDALDIKARKEQAVKNLIEEFSGYTDIEIDTLVNKAKSERIDRGFLKDKIISRLQDEIIFLQKLPDDTDLSEYKYVLKGDLGESRIY